MALRFESHIIMIRILFQLKLSVYKKSLKDSNPFFEDSTLFSSKSFCLQNLLKDSNLISKDSNHFSPKSFCLQNLFKDSNPSSKDSNRLSPRIFSNIEDSNPFYKDSNLFFFLKSSLFEKCSMRSESLFRGFKFNILISTKKRLFFKTQ